MHDDLSHIKIDDLFDMLTVQTNRYMKMLSDGATRVEFNKCREMIIDIQTEIQERHNRDENSAAAGKRNISFN